MIIIVGLGNPGEKFNSTRHNAGFEALDFFAKQHNSGNFEVSKKYHALICEHENIVLVKPETFMNESGKTIKALLKNKPTATLVVVHDDIDMPLGKIKFSKDSGSGGHKGVDSVIHLVGKDFIRLKIGVATDDKKAIDVVLEKFNKEEQEVFRGVIEKSAQALDYLIENGLEKTMNQYN